MAKQIELEKLEPNLLALDPLSQEIAGQLICLVQDAFQSSISPECLRLFETVGGS